MAVNPAIISIILETIDVIKAIMADIRESGTDSHVPTGAIAAKLDDILNGTTAVSAPTAAPAEPVAAPKIEAMSPAAPPAAPVAPPQTLGEILV